ncbi:MAG: ABC transporter permease [Frankiaceae bacterium]|nr:ABC transporter permease [Frankiaceae bacterium]
MTTPTWTTWHGYAALDAPPGERARAATGDLAEGFRRWRLWTFLALNEIKSQYSRTVVGPWWLTLQTLVYVAGITFLFGTLFHQPVRVFLPYVAIGVIVFSLLGGMTRFCANVFVGEASSIVSSRQPLSALLLRGVSVEFLQFAHHLVILVVIAAAGLLVFNVATLLVIPALLLIALNGFALGLWLAPAVARFRDIGPVVASVLQMLSFFTPIFWRVDSLSGQKRASLLAWNPFYYLLETIRGPLLGNAALHPFVGAVVITAVNVGAGMLVFSHTRSRIPYWIS